MPSTDSTGMHRALELVTSSVSLARQHTDDVEWSAEDGTRTEPDFLCRCVEAAIKAGSLRYPDEAKLRLGEAYAAAGKKQQAISTLREVGGKEGTAELARYWIMAINKPLAG